MEEKLYCNRTDFIRAKYKSYWAFLWLLTCTEQQFRYFQATPAEDSFEEFNWAYNLLNIQHRVWHKEK